MEMESITYDEAEFQRLYDQLLGYMGKDPELAEQIKTLRMARGLTQNDLAERMGVPQSQVSRWENKGGCEIESLERLCKALAQRQAVKVTVAIRKFLTGPADSDWEQTILAEFELYSWPERAADGGAAIRRYICGQFPFPSGKAHTKSGVYFRIAVEGEQQEESGWLDRPEASVRWTLYELQKFLCRVEGDRLRIWRYACGNSLEEELKRGWLSEMELVRQGYQNLYTVQKWKSVDQGADYPYGEGQTCMFMPLAWDNCRERDFDRSGRNVNLMINTLLGNDWNIGKAGFGEGGFSLYCRRRIELDICDEAGNPLGYYTNALGGRIALKLRGRILLRAVKKLEDDPQNEEELWSEIQEGYFMAVYEADSEVNEYALMEGESRRVKAGKTLDSCKVTQKPFRGRDGSVYYSERWGRRLWDYHLEGSRELWLKNAEPDGAETTQGEILNYSDYSYRMADWELAEKIPEINFGYASLTGREQVRFDCRSVLRLSGDRDLVLVRDMRDMRRYGCYMIYFKVAAGRYCCVQYNGNTRTSDGPRCGESCVGLTFCSGADAKDGAPDPQTFRPLPGDDPANYTYLFRLSEVKNHLFTGLPLKMGERSFVDFCLEVRKDFSFTNLRRLLPKTEGPGHCVLIYRWQDGKAYLGGIENGEFKDQITRGFEDINSGKLWLKGFGDASDRQAVEQVKGIFAYPAMMGVAVSAWENPKNYPACAESGARENGARVDPGHDVGGGAVKTGAHADPGHDVGESNPITPPAASTSRPERPLPPGHITREMVSARLFPPEEGAVEAPAIVDTVYRLVVERGYGPGGSAPEGACSAGRLPGIVILGKPGVGKSTLADRLVETLVEFHVIPRSDTDPDHTLTTVNARDLVGRFIGHTRPKTLKVIIQAIERKNALFLDDVYTLFNTSGQDFGHEVLEALLPVLKGECRLPKIVTDEKSGEETEQYETFREDQLPTIIMAGYEKETRRFLNDNPGLYSRVTVLEMAAPSVSELVRDLEYRICRCEPELLPRQRLEGEALRQAENFYRRVTGQEYADQFAYFRGNETLAGRLVTEYRFLRSQGEEKGWEPIWRSVTEAFIKELIDNYESILEANEERMGRTRKQFKVEQDISETFADVKGQETAVEKLGEVADMLTHSEAYRLTGARLPKGALLVGPPGTGKTLMARALAGETARRMEESDPGAGKGQTAFIALAATDLLAGGQSTGADRVRDLFLQAQKAEAASVVIFIDELDAVAKKRGSKGGADEVLIALLACMDGFSGNKNLFVLGATNRPEILDPALLRPGRFDRRIPVGLPDRTGREDILRLYAEKQLRPALAALLQTDGSGLDARWSECAEEVIRQIAAKSYGASPAELSNLINEAGILAAKRGWRPQNGPSADCLYTVTLGDVMEALETMIVGLPSRKSPDLRDKRIVAIHEIGHAVLRVVDGNGCPVAGNRARKPFEKVTCVPRGESALGYVINPPREEKYLETKDDLLGEVRCLLGGRAAEELDGGNGGITQGAGDDLKAATKIVKKMVAEYGMYDVFGPAAVSVEISSYLGNGPDCNILPGLEREMSLEVIRIIKEQYELVQQILARYHDALLQLAETLIQRETLSGEEFMEIWTDIVG